MGLKQGTGTAVRLSLLVAGLLVLSIPAPAGAGAGNFEFLVYQTFNLSAINTSLPKATHPSPFAPALVPITLLHLELNETTPTGVRYMAFSPKVFEIAMSPALLVFLMVLAAGAAGAWYLPGRRRNGN